MSLTAPGKIGVKKIAQALLLFLLLAGAGTARAESDAIVFQSTETPPFWTQSLPDNGMGGAMLQLLSKAAGVRYSIEYLPVKRFRNSLAAYIVGDPDILLNQKQRAILPIGIFRSAFFFYKPHHDVIDFHGLRDLQGHTLGVLRGTLENKDYFVDNGIKVEESNSIESLLQKLKKGRIDFCILVDAAGQFTIKQLFPAEENNFAQVAIANSIRPITIMIDLTVPAGRGVAEHYRQVLQQTLQSRSYHDILERFYGKNNIPADWFEQLKKFENYYASSWEQ